MFLLISLVLVLLATWYVSRRQSSGTTTTKLRGPPANSLFFGRKEFSKIPEASLYVNWAREYGSAYELTAALGAKRVVLFDPKAVAHVGALDTTVYVNHGITRSLAEMMFGKGLSWAEGDDHKRQRKMLLPAFSSTIIKDIFDIFLDCAHKTELAWHAKQPASRDDGTIIEVQHWANCISLDSIGIAGFSHDFMATQGRRSVVQDMFEGLNLQSLGTIEIVTLTIAFIFPSFVHFSGRINRVVHAFKETIHTLGKDLLAGSRAEDVANIQGKSIIDILVKSENVNNSSSLSEEEVFAQISLLISAGYETTSATITWALIELSRRPEVQDKLYEELRALGSADPTLEQLNHGFPYLDAFIHEVLRQNALVIENFRIAAQDDVIPLSTSVQDRDGNIIDRLTIAKGTMVTMPLAGLNMSENIWGPNASEFMPERWMDENTFNLHSHLLAFGSGQRACLGRGFAIATMKAVLCVLVRSFEFSFPPNVDTKVELHLGFLPRPKLAGEEGPRVPLLIKRRSD